DQRLNEIFDRFRYRLGLMLALTLAVGVLLAAATMRHILRLARAGDLRYRQVVHARSELKELSARLVEAQELERRAISRELHDEVGQSLTALLIDVENLTEMSSKEGAFRQGLQKIKTLAENCVNEVRNMALLLRPSMLDDLGLVAALD